VFTGERREVTVMFIDIRDFTPFAEATRPRTRWHASPLCSKSLCRGRRRRWARQQVPRRRRPGRLRRPNDLADHADAAVAAAVVNHRLVTERFGGALRIGIGINTGLVIAGTIGGGGKLEFTLIGDTVNVAARVEQLTKTTGDAILLTHHTVDALVARPHGLVDRESHELKGKSAAVQVFALDPTQPPAA
jgi:adenylate cyclase